MIAATEDLIRRAEPGDAETCGDILNAWIDDRDWMPRVHTAEDVRAFYRDFVLPNRQLWVTGDPVDGFLALDAEGAMVTALYVARPGRGTGKRLMDFAKAGRGRLTLWTFQANTRARAFYAREGFREVRMTDGDNEEGLPDVLLEWVRDG
jgi:GNAT superfamily N-acetyltransferase